MSRTWVSVTASSLVAFLFALGYVSSIRLPGDRSSVATPPPVSSVLAALDPDESIEPPSPFLTDVERRILEGEVDELGWVLPLDVRRPPPPPPDPAALPRPRIVSGAPAPGETRLGADDSHTQNETSIAIDGETLVAGWNAFTGSGAVMGVGRSTDGGLNWSSATLATFSTMSDPAVAAGGGGRWYYGYIATGGVAGGDYDVFVQRSVDDGATWMAPVAATSNSTFDDKPFLAARGLDVLVGYADFSSSPAKVRAVTSNDGGVSFGHNTVLIDSPTGGGNGACPVIAPDGTFYVFWRDSLQQFLWMARSDDHGETWNGDESIVAMHPLPSSVPAPQGGYRLLNLPSAAALPNGDLVVVWNDQLFGDADILAIRSSDGGANWSAPVRVNDDPAGSLQFFPWVATDGLGRVHVVWYDRRNDAVDLDVYTAVSTDGGATFGANVRVTEQSFTPVLPSEGGAASFIGDYNGIAAGDAGIFPFYQDSRRGEQDVWVRRLETLLFRDGFETAGTGEWSATVP